MTEKLVRDTNYSLLLQVLVLNLVWGTGSESKSPLDGIQIIENFVFYFFVLTKSKTRTPSHELVYPSSSLIEISTHSAYSSFPSEPSQWQITGLPHLYGARSLSRASASCPP